MEGSSLGKVYTRSNLTLAQAILIRKRLSRLPPTRTRVTQPHLQTMATVLAEVVLSTLTLPPLLSLHRLFSVPMTLTLSICSFSSSRMSLLPFLRDKFTNFLLF